MRLRTGSDASLSPPYDAGGVASPDCRDADLTEALQPMLEAVVRLAGATAATVRLVGADGAAGALVATVGRSAIAAATPWCAVCDEAVDPASECVRRHVCGTADQFVASTVTQVCRHVAVVPLEHRAHPVGTLALLFAAPCRLPAEMSLLLKAVGDLLGVTLENARLTRENLRMSLMHERQMMANEVHDSLAQALTFMRMRMSLLSDAIRQRDELRAFKYWGDVDDSLTNAHRRLRELITYFRSRMDPQGLVHALAETADGFFDRTGVTLTFENRVPELLPAGRSRGRDLPHRPGGAGQRLPARARPARRSATRPRTPGATKSPSSTTAWAWARILTPMMAATTDWRSCASARCGSAAASRSTRRPARERAFVCSFRRTTRQARRGHE